MQHKHNLVLANPRGLSYSEVEDLQTTVDLHH